MLDDMFKLTVDSVFNQTATTQAINNNQGDNNGSKGSQFAVPGYEDTISMWDHIYSFT